MKKNLFKWTIAAAALVLTVGVVTAQNTTAKSVDKPRKACYVDANNNGLCDRFDNGTCRRENGQGLRDGSGQGQKGQSKNGRGQGMCKGSRCSSPGQGPNYVDANKNGVCDYRENVTKK